MVSFGEPGPQDRCFTFYPRKTRVRMCTPHIPSASEWFIEVHYVLDSLNLLVSETEFCYITHGNQELEIFLSPSPNNLGYRSGPPNVAFLFGFKWVVFDNTSTNSTITITSSTL